MTIEMYEEVMKHLQIDQCRKLIIEQNQKIADLEDKLANADYQLEGRDNEIAELKEKNKELAKDLAIHCQDTQEVINEYEKENTELQHKVDTLQGFLDHDIEYDMDKTIQELRKENAELKSEKGCESCTKFDEVKLAKAKEIVENFLKEFERMDVLCNYQLRTQAEQFLNEE